MKIWISNIYLSSGITESLEQDDTGRTRRRAVFGDEDEDEDMEDDDDDEDDDSDQEMLDSDEEMDEDDEDIPTRGRALTKFDTRNIPRKGEKEDKEERDNGQDVQFADSDSDLGLDDEDDEEDMVNIDGRQKNDDNDEELAGELRWKANLKEKASAMFNATRRVNLMSLIYDKTDISPEDIASGNFNQDDQEDGDQDDEDEEFFTLKREVADEASEAVDTSREQIKADDLEIWGDDDVRMRYSLRVMKFMLMFSLLNSIWILFVIALSLVNKQMVMLKKAKKRKRKKKKRSMVILKTWKMRMQVTRRKRMKKKIQWKQNVNVSPNAKKSSRGSLRKNMKKMKSPRWTFMSNARQRLIVNSR